MVPSCPVAFTRVARKLGVSLCLFDVLRPSDRVASQELCTGVAGLGCAGIFPRYFGLQICRRSGVAFGVALKSAQRAFPSYEGSDLLITACFFLSSFVTVRLSLTHKSHELCKAESKPQSSLLALPNVENVEWAPF